MLSWGAIGYGDARSVVLAVVIAFVVRERLRWVLVFVAASAIQGVVA